MNQYACAITGHRPTRFCFGYNEEYPLCQKLKECLLKQFRILHAEKFVRTFFVGGALGVDMWAGEQLLTLKSQTGYEDIKIIVVIPFIGYDSKWQGQSRHRLKKLRSGTAQTVNYALHHGKTITLIHPDTMEITSPTT